MPFERNSTLLVRELCTKQSTECTCIDVTIYSVLSVYMYRGYKYMYTILHMNGLGHEQVDSPLLIRVVSKWEEYPLSEDCECNFKISLICLSTSELLILNNILPFCVLSLSTLLGWLVFEEALVAWLVWLDGEMPRALSINNLAPSSFIEDGRTKKSPSWNKSRQLHYNQISIFMYR